MMYNGSAVFSQTGGENFIATKTISETFYGGTSYTAWNMERVSNLQQAFSRIAQVPNLNIGTWQITSALTNANGTFQNYNQYAGKQKRTENDFLFGSRSGFCFKTTVRIDLNP